MQPAIALLAAASLVVAAPAVAATLSPQMPTTLIGERPIVIGHRGAPAYLPENTSGGNELALRLGATWIETDIQVTQDGVIVAMHDASLERTTDVQTVYPGRASYDVAEFTFAEIQALTVRPTGEARASYPGFDPASDRPYRVPSLAGMLADLREADPAAGILVEGKNARDPEVNRRVLETMIAAGYDSPERAAVQSFDHGNVRDYGAILEDLGVRMDVAQLGVAVGVAEAWLVASTGGFVDGFSGVPDYATGLALRYPEIEEGTIRAAHDLGLFVYGWTFRPGDQNEADAIVAPFLDWGLDGFITDNPDLVRAAIDARFPAAQVPIPAAGWLLAAGLGALALRRRA